MTDEQRKIATEARRAYHREWRRKNKEKVREYNQNYWLRKAKDGVNNDQRS